MHLGRGRGAIPADVREAEVVDDKHEKVWLHRRHCSLSCQRRLHLLGPAAGGEEAQADVQRGMQVAACAVARRGTRLHGQGPGKASQG